MALRSLLAVEVVLVHDVLVAVLQAFVQHVVTFGPWHFDLGALFVKRHEVCVSFLVALNEERTARKDVRERLCICVQRTCVCQRACKCVGFFVAQDGTAQIGVRKRLCFCKHVRGMRACVCASVCVRECRCAHEVVIS